MKTSISYTLAHTFFSSFKGGSANLLLVLPRQGPQQLSNFSFGKFNNAHIHPQRHSCTKLIKSVPSSTLGLVQVPWLMCVYVCVCVQFFNSNILSELYSVLCMEMGRGFLIQLLLNLDLRLLLILIANLVSRY